MSFWRGRPVLVTGHTGFKGSWLSLWLDLLGAEVSGIAQLPATEPSMFREARVSQRIKSAIADIRDLDSVCAIVRESEPEVVFHLAAQPLVRTSYEDPVRTYTTNVIGTVNLLEAVRRCNSVRAVVVITTDKCYENKEWIWPYRESDRLGGYDPYSNSKACAELVVSAYRNSFFPPAHHADHGTAIASVRAGNVIGGGDWSKDRLVPDIIRAFMGDTVLKIRNPKAVRPWQHVLEPLRGYLSLAEKLCEDGPEYGGAWNFGPNDNDARRVEWIVQEMAADWGEGAQWETDGQAHPHEAQMLRLDWSKAAQELDWHPALTLSQALQLTVDWYRGWQAGEDARLITLQQIHRYMQLFSERSDELGQCVPLLPLSRGVAE